jgi:hypothetical protein|tara:strand:- start:605 stop:826 length:222 start_codon:yes stop_codon:yes gene_type:complete
MAERIEWLNELPVELQEKILEYISSPHEPSPDRKLHPIEIDGVIYHVPHPVVELVDTLWGQLNTTKKVNGSSF